jgi:hypothetical protein
MLLFQLAYTYLPVMNRLFQNTLKMLSMWGRTVAAREACLWDYRDRKIGVDQSREWVIAGTWLLPEMGSMVYPEFPNKCNEDST